MNIIPYHVLVFCLGCGSTLFVVRRDSSDVKKVANDDQCRKPETSFGMLTHGDIYLAMLRKKLAQRKHICVFYVTLIESALLFCFIILDL